jgi:amino acid transporter
VTKIEKNPGAPNSGEEPYAAESVDVSKRDDVHQLERHALGMPGVLFLALAGAAPMSAMLGNVPIAVGFGNGTSAAGGYILAGIVLTLFSVGYVAMTRQFTAAGGFYSFISHGLGRPLGMAAGWAGVAAYSLFEAGEWGIFAYFTASTFSQFLHINLAWPVYAFLGLFIVAALTYFDVKLSAKVLGTALIAEVILLLVMDFFILGKGGGPSGIAFGPLNPISALSGANIKLAAPGVGIFFALWSWVGFETTANYAEEAKNPKKMVSRATYVAVLSMGVVFTLTAWAVVLGHGLKGASASAASNSGNFFFGVTSHYVDPFAKNLMEWLIITSTFACAMAFHTATTRYFYAMGRERIFNHRLGWTHKRWQSPWVASFFQSAVAAVLILIFVIAWYASKPEQKFANFATMPYSELYGWFAILGTFFVLILMVLSGIATIRWFGRPENRKLEHPAKWLVAPIVSSIALGYAVYLLWANINTLGGGHILILTLLPWIGTAWFLIGLVIASVIRKRNPKKYEVLGRMLNKGI